MATSNVKLFLLCVSISVSILSATCHASLEKGFLQCFQSGLRGNTSKIVFTKTSSSYKSVLDSSIRNTKFLTGYPKPKVIITPQNLFHIQLALQCSNKYKLQVRIRSGGHDCEGLSYISQDPFFIIDLTNLRSITIDMKDQTAWVQSGATLGELYYAIAKTSLVHGFPAGSCPTIGVGGHFSGGGYGTIFRKYGLAADNVIDAQIIDANGNILNRASMGEDLFWAIRGGGGSSFGVITSWRIKLVPVPSTVSMFDVSRTLEQGASELFHKWQSIGHDLPPELFLHTVAQVVNSSSSARGGNKTVTIAFKGLYLGPAESFHRVMTESFPELGVERNHYSEMSWISSVLYFAGYSVDDPYWILENRNITSPSFKEKTDYVKEPISLEGLEGLWKIMLVETPKVPRFTFIPYGGRMSEISESEIPFPHRKGILYGIEYFANLVSSDELPKHSDWMRDVHYYMEPYVSKGPRLAYWNYRDLDMGFSGQDPTYDDATLWGLRYFNGNFERLARVKGRVDPQNFFRDQQSTPPLM